jgi:hypothetical protein
MLDEIDIRKIAYETDTDIRSVRKELSGQKVRGRVGDRIRRALAALAVEPVQQTTSTG